MKLSLSSVDDARRLLERTFGDVSDRIGDFEAGTGIDVIRKTMPTKEPQRSFMWEVEFKSPIQKYDRDSKYIKFYAKTTAIPASINEVIKRHYAGVEYAYSGKDTSPRIFRVTFWDDEELNVYKFFQRWYEIMQQGPDRRKVSPDVYMMDITLRLKDHSDSFTTQGFIFRNAFPSEISETSLSYSESTEMTFDVMFTFRDKVLAEQNRNPLKGEVLPEAFR